MKEPPMTATQLRSRYPKLWRSVYDMTLDDIRLAKKTDKFVMTKTTAERIAHNAAFIACSTLHTMVSK